VPISPLARCSTPMCSGFATNRGKCAECDKPREQLRLARFDAGRPSARQRGYDTRWSRFSQQYRRRFRYCGSSHPSAPRTADSVCRREGKRTPAAVVDHIARLTGPDDPRKFDESNLQSLCDPCHDRKRARESLAARRKSGTQAEPDQAEPSKSASLAEDKESDCLF
jgi:5-methylcytosine-specific restriction protein A